MCVIKKVNWIHIQVQAITISGYSMTSSKSTSGADLEETHLVLFFEL